MVGPPQSRHSSPRGQAECLGGGGNRAERKSFLRNGQVMQVRLGLCQIENVCVAAGVDMSGSQGG